MIFGIYSRCTPLLLGTQVSDIGPSKTFSVLLDFDWVGCTISLEWLPTIWSGLKNGLIRKPSSAVCNVFGAVSKMW